MRLDACAALVTGGAVRIGRSICEALAARGCRVVVHYRHSAEEAGRLVTAIRAAGGSAWSVQGDLGGEAQCEAVLDAAWQAAGGINVLVNNASVFHRDPWTAVNETKLHEELRVNAMAPVLLTLSLARRIARERGAGDGLAGKVVNLLDRRVAGTETGCLPYLLSKKMLDEFTRVAALELAPALSVNAVAPGAILPPSDAGGDLPFVAAGAVPLQRQCTPEEVAAAVVFLLESDAVTGQTIYVDGGQHLSAG